MTTRVPPSSGTFGYRLLLGDMVEAKQWRWYLLVAYEEIRKHSRGEVRIRIARRPDLWGTEIILERGEGEPYTIVGNVEAL